MCATTLLLVFALWLRGGGVPALNGTPSDRMYVTYFPGGAQAMTVWVSLAAVLGVLLPVTLIWTWRSEPALRQVLLPYAVVLALQIVLEGIAGGLITARSVPFIGFVFTLFRIWQLRWALDVLRPDTVGYPSAYRAARLLLRVGLVFWSANILMLVVFITTSTRLALR